MPCTAVSMRPPPTSSGRTRVDTHVPRRSRSARRLTRPTSHGMSARGESQPSIEIRSVSAAVEVDHRGTHLVHPVDQCPRRGEAETVPSPLCCRCHPVDVTDLRACASWGRQACLDVADGDGSDSVTGWCVDDEGADVGPQPFVQGGGSDRVPRRGSRVYQIGPDSGLVGGRLSRAHIAALVRSATPSLRKMLPTCTLTVRSLMPRNARSACSPAPVEAIGEPVAPDC